MSGLGLQAWGPANCGHTMKSPLLVPQLLAIENRVALPPSHGILGSTSDLDEKKTKLKARRQGKKDV